MNCTERRMTYARAGEIFRAMQGDDSLLDTIRLCDVAGLEHADTFADFIDANRDSLQLFDPPYNVLYVMASGYAWAKISEPYEKYCLVEKDLDISARW